MDAYEPRVRRRGFFLHSTDINESDAGEHENPEGFPVRVRTTPSPAPRHFTGGRQARAEGRTDDAQPEIRSGSVTGSRQRAHLPR
jgi:hypothetical protein